MALNKLTDVTVRKTDLRPGRYSDGGNLYLNVSRNRTKSWVFMYSRNKQRRREMGLGAYPGLTLTAARQKALDAQHILASGDDPIEVMRKVVPTFEEASKGYIKDHKAGWKNEKHIQQWKNTLATYCTSINGKKVNEISVSDILEVLKPIWKEKPETASRLRGRIERVLSAAKVKGWRTGENPAVWKDNLSLLLPRLRKLKRGNHKAMSYGKVPAFFSQLVERDAISAKALSFTILTAARSDEALGARWAEIDFARKVWKRPAERMKGQLEHEVPLSDAAMTILMEMRAAGHDSEFIFPGQKSNRPLSSAAMDTLLKQRMKVTDATVHGFRSTFRDWCGDKTGFPRELAETALAHLVGNEVERAYRRSDALEKRRRLMQAWANYLIPPKRGNIVDFEARKQA